MSRKEWKENERQPDNRLVCVEEETARLNTMLTWGPSGSEAVLALFLPYEISLFLDKMEVENATVEYEEMESLYRSKGVEVIRVKDELAKVLEVSNAVPMSRNVAELVDLLKQKALKYNREFGVGDISWLDRFEGLIQLDVARYGEKVAILLNEMVCEVGSEVMPMANVMFGRDQSTVIGDTFVWSNMSMQIRQPEVHLWQVALAERLDGVRQIAVCGEGRLEGGDVYVSEGICFVGVGGRTNREGVRQIASEVLRQGMRLMYVVHPERESGKMEHQTTMHLDTFSMPAPDKSMVLLVEEALARQVVEIMPDGSEVYLGNHYEVLESLGYSIIPVTRDQQLAYATNYVNLGSREVVLTMGCNRDKQDHSLTENLTARGVGVTELHVEAITQAFGGLHCSCAPIKRS